MRFWGVIAMAAGGLLVLAAAAATAETPDSEALSKRLEQIEMELATVKAQAASSETRIAALSARLDITATMANVAKAAIAHELAQPMLLLVGMGPCPSNFKRIVTRVLILTRTRTSENGQSFDEAGLTYEDPPGVGDNVYRDLDFCYRRANSVKLE